MLLVLKEQPAPLNTPERLGLYAYLLWLQVRNPSDYAIGVKSNLIIFGLINDIAQGKPQSRSIREERRLFPSYTTYATGTENIPQKAPFIFAANHYNKGPLRGIWETAAIADILARNMPNGFDYRSRLIIDSKKDSTGLFGEKSKSIANQMIEHVLYNAAVTLDLIPEDQPLEALETLKSGNIVGVFPTGNAEFSLTKGLAKTGRLFEVATRYGAPTIPIGVYHAKKEKSFIINIGKPLWCKPNLKNPNSHQETVDNVMSNIASLLPPQMRGAYA